MGGSNVKTPDRPGSLPLQEPTTSLVVPLATAGIGAQENSGNCLAGMQDQFGPLDVEGGD